MATDYNLLDKIRREAGARAVGLLDGLLKADAPIGCAANVEAARDIVAQWNGAEREAQRSDEAAQAELRG